MKAVLYIASMTIFFVGFLFFAGSKSAIHETESFVLFLISAVLFSGAAIVGAIDGSSQKKIEKPSPETHAICPDCKEYVLKGAVVCKHCGCKLTGE